ncbi:MAG: OmpA family protein [Proteobacteria bacterium]|nr:OmpA family protein [Pseudomonadota bacterium]
MKATITTLACAVLLGGSLAGCANMNETQKDTATGAGVGALAGAAIGAVVNGHRGAAAGALIGGAAGAGGGYLWSQKMQQQKQQMEQATAGTGIGVTQTADNRLKLNIPSDISFDVGRSDIKPNFASVLNQFGTTLNQNPVTTITIVGYTDSTGGDAINQPLSLARADSTRNYLVGRGVAANRFVTQGMGASNPIGDNNTAAGRAMNRRVEIFVAEPAQASK